VKKLIQSLSILAFFMAIVPKADASILIEPVVGYNLTGKYGDDSSMGPSYGGRLGWQNLGFQLGLDYLNSNIDVDSNDIKDPLAMSEWAAFVGFEFPILLRAYAGYIFSANGTSKSDGGAKIELTEGTGMKAGIGFTMLPFLDINLEYRKGTFGETKIGGSSTGDETDYSAYMIGVSLPFNI